MNDQVFGSNQDSPNPLPFASFKPIDTNAVNGLLSLDDEYALGGNLLERRRIRLPKSVVWGILVILGLAAIAAVVWGLAQSTWTYGVPTMDSATTTRLAQLRDKLSTAGAPGEALRYLETASQPGINVGDAIEALVSADQALEPASASTAISSARQELRAILDDLNRQRYGYYSTATPRDMTPLPSLAIPTP